MFFDFKGENFLHVFGIVLIAFILTYAHIIGKKEFDKKTAAEQAIREEQEKIKALEKAAYDKKRAYYFELYGEKSMKDLVQFPKGVEIGLDGLPKEVNSSKWGKKYTFYIAKSGNVYHVGKCNKAATTAIHALNIPENRTPCKRCNPNKPDMAWYFEYNEILKIKKIITFHKHILSRYF